jgi:hypothetical protein
MGRLVFGEGDPGGGGTLERRICPALLDLHHLSLGFRAAGGQPRMKAQDIKQRLAAHIAQHDTKRESGNGRAKYHQHTYVDSHNGPSNQSFDLPKSCIDGALYLRHQCVIVTDRSVALTLVSVGE